MSNENPLLDVHNVSFTLDDTPLLAPISLQLHAGEFAWVNGPSGSGKSTLLKILASLLEPTSGNITFNGEPIAQYRPESYRQQVSYCFQTPVLFGETVYDNMALPWLIRDKKVDRQALSGWLEKVNLAPQMLDKKIDQLSGGEKQRVALLRNLQFLPKVLLLDEITSALDDENKQVIHQLISGIVKKSRVAVMWISHDSEEIRHAQRVITVNPPQTRGQYERA